MIKQRKKDVTFEFEIRFKKKNDLSGKKVCSHTILSVICCCLPCWDVHAFQLVLEHGGFHSILWVQNSQNFWILRTSIVFGPDGSAIHILLEMSFSHTSLSTTFDLPYGAVLLYIPLLLQRVCSNRPNRWAPAVQNKTFGNCP